MITKERIKGIKRLPKTEDYVYDVSVPGNEMFFANDILVHNTDSMFLHIDPVLKSIYGVEYEEVSEDDKINKTLEIIKNVSNYINDYVMKKLLYLHNTNPETSLASKFNFQFKEEFVIKRALFLEEKKRYAAWVVLKEGRKIDQLNITGIEVVRSDYPKYSRNMLYELLDSLLRKNMNRTEAIAFIDKSIKEYLAILRTGNIEAGIPGSWGLHTYAKDTRIINAMKVYNIITGTNTFISGDRGYRFELKGFKLDSATMDKLDNFKKENNLTNNLIMTIAIPENKPLPLDKIILNEEKMVEFSIYKRLEPILNILNINVTKPDTPDAW